MGTAEGKKLPCENRALSSGYQKLVGSRGEASPCAVMSKFLQGRVEVVGEMGDRGIFTGVRELEFTRCFANWTVMMTKWSWGSLNMRCPENVGVGTTTSCRLIIRRNHAFASWLLPLIVNQVLRQEVWEIGSHKTKENIVINERPLIRKFC